MKMIINVQDQVLGSWHQITVEQRTVPTGDFDNATIRLDGGLLPPRYELHHRIAQMVGAWEDEFEGVTDKEAYL